jgi:hypothetical protein
MKKPTMLLAMLALVVATGAFAMSGLPGDKQYDVKDVSWFFENGTGTEVVVTIDGVTACRLGAWDMARVKVTPGSHEWAASGAGRSWGGTMQADRTVELVFTVK